MASQFMGSFSEASVERPASDVGWPPQQSRQHPPFSPALTAWLGIDTQAETKDYWCRVSVRLYLAIPTSLQASMMVTRSKSTSIVDEQWMILHRVAGLRVRIVDFVCVERSCPEKRASEVRWSMAAGRLKGGRKKQEWARSSSSSSLFSPTKIVRHRVKASCAIAVSML